MRRLIKKRIEEFIFVCINKYRQREISGDNEYNIGLSKGAKLIDPMKIGGGDCISIGENSSIGRMAWIEAFKSYGKQAFNPKIIIGDNVRIGNYACITSINSIVIGNGCLFSEYIYISDHAHGVNLSTNQRPVLQDLNSKGTVEIGENTFLGFRVSVLPGVKLGRNCVVGANSVVTKSFPDNSMIAGIPARMIKKFSIEEGDWEV